DRVMLRVEAGLNKPDSSWFNALKDRLDHDARSLEVVRAEHYAKLSDLTSVQTQLISIIEQTKNDFRIENLENRLQAEFNSIHPELMRRAREELSLENPLFKADPETTHHLFMKEAYEHVVSALTEIKRRHLITSSIRTQGSNTPGKPFLEKRLSQDAL